MSTVIGGASVGCGDECIDTNCKEGIDASGSFRFSSLSRSSYACLITSWTEVRRHLLEISLFCSFFYGLYDINDSGLTILCASILLLILLSSASAYDLTP